LRSGEHLTGTEEATMPTVKEATSEFPAKKRIAVTGVSRTCFVFTRTGRVPKQV
jgi:hypothetical protein